jgi:hypothetical protein
MNKSLLVIKNKLPIIEKYLKEYGTVNCSCLDKIYISKQFQNLEEYEIKAVIDNSIKILNNNNLPHKNHCLNHERLINGYKITFPDRKFTKYIDYKMYKL